MEVGTSTPWQANHVDPAEFVVVRFHRPVDGTDPLDGYLFTADRHRVAARWAQQDENETIFVDDTGEIVARWPTSQISHIDWPKLARPATPAATRSEESAEPADAAHKRPRAGTLEWREKVLSEFPRAYQRWSEQEDRELVVEYEAGMGVSEMSARHQRRPGGIMARLVRLGLIEPTTRESSIGN